jgi:hypothetical protein
MVSPQKEATRRLSTSPAHAIYSNFAWSQLSGLGAGFVRRTGATGGISGDGITASGDAGKFKP